MKFSVAAVIAAAAGAQAWAGNVTYTTEVVTAVTTYCPYATQITYGSSTYTITEATTLTITDCPCTVTKPVSVTSTPYGNSTAVAPKTTPTKVGTISASATKPASSSIATAGAAKAAGLTGAGLAGVLGAVAAFL